MCSCGVPKAGHGIRDGAEEGRSRAVGPKQPVSLLSVLCLTARMVPPRWSLAGFASAASVTKASCRSLSCSCTMPFLWGAVLAAAPSGLGICWSLFATLPPSYLSEPVLRFKFIFLLSQAVDLVYVSTHCPRRGAKGRTSSRLKLSGQIQTVGYCLHAALDRVGVSSQLPNFLFSQEKAAAEVLKSSLRCLPRRPGHPGVFKTLAGQSSDKERQRTDVVPVAPRAQRRRKRLGTHFLTAPKGRGGSLSLWGSEASLHPSSQSRSSGA